MTRACLFLCVLAGCAAARLPPLAAPMDRLRFELTAEQVNEACAHAEADLEAALERIARVPEAEPSAATVLVPLEAATSEEAFLEQIGAAGSEPHAK